MMIALWSSIGLLFIPSIAMLVKFHLVDEDMDRAFRLGRKALSEVRYGV